jgi:hypothetical protein
MVDLNKAEHWDTPIFPLVVVAEAAMVAPATLRQWIVRYGDDLKLWQGDAASGRAEASGFGHKFSLRDALHIAAAARLIAKGITVRDAYAAALHWAHMGQFDNPAVYANEPAPKLIRQPAGLFALPAWTFLIHQRGADARVSAVTPQDGALPFQFADLFEMNAPPASSAPTIVFLNLLDRHVRFVCDKFLHPDGNRWDETSVSDLLD